jgi:hypothetical protein
MEDFETALSGGHPNSLGRTIEVVDAVLADRSLLGDLYQCYFSSDEVVRLRVASAMKRMAIAEPGWVMDYMDGLQSDIAAIDQPSVQWTLALIFDATVDHLSAAQRRRAVEIMKQNIAHRDDWIVLNNSMKVLGRWAMDDTALAEWLRPHAKRLKDDRRTSVASSARKLLERIESNAS